MPREAAFQNKTTYVSHCSRFPDGSPAGRKRGMLWGSWFMHQTNKQNQFFRPLLQKNRADGNVLTSISQNRQLFPQNLVFSVQMHQDFYDIEEETCLVSSRWVTQVKRFNTASFWRRKHHKQYIFELHYFCYSFILVNSLNKCVLLVLRIFCLPWLILTRPRPVLPETVSRKCLRPCCSCRESDFI